MRAGGPSAANDGRAAIERRSARVTDTPVETPRVMERVAPPVVNEGSARGSAGLTLVRGDVEPRRAGGSAATTGSGTGLAVAEPLPDRIARPTPATAQRAANAVPAAAPQPVASPLPAAAPSPRTGLGINQLVERWDEIVAQVRRDRPIVGTLLERAIPTAVTATGVVTLQVEEMGSFEGLAAKTRELTTALAVHVGGLSRVQLLPPESARDSGPRRMTAESIKSETLQALRKKDAVLAAAIDELDLDLVG